MARTVTLVSMRQEVRDLGEFRNPPFTDAMIDKWINAGWAQLWGVLSDVDILWNVDTETLSIVSGTAEYALDVDFFKLIGVDVLDDQNRWIPLERCNHSQRHLEYWSRGINRLNTRYMLRNRKIVLVPTPTWSGSAEVYFTPAYPVLGDGTGTTVVSVDSNNDWTEWVVFYAWRKALIREESSTGDVTEMMREVERRIISSMKSRDKANPPTIRDRDAEAGLKKYY